MADFNITRAAHAELRVKDLDRSRYFYCNLLGMIETGKDDESLYLGGLEETDKYSLVLRKAKSPGLKHVAFRVADENGLGGLYTKCIKTTCVKNMRWVQPNTLENGQGLALRIQDPNGMPVEFFCETEKRERFLQKFSLYKGAEIMRLDHFNWQVSNVEIAYKWWLLEMGFRMSECTVTDDDPERIWAVWLHRKQNVHDMAIMNGVGPRLHHVAFWVRNEMSIIKACDILASVGMTDLIERGPGRHGISNAFFLYLRDPDGNRIELFTNDYMIPDPDFKTIKWKLSDPRRATFWGHHPPKSWFEEASLVENIITGEFMPVTEPILTGKPSFIT